MCFLAAFVAENYSNNILVNVVVRSTNLDSFVIDISCFQNFYIAEDIVSIDKRNNRPRKVICALYGKKKLNSINDARCQTFL